MLVAVYRRSGRHPLCFVAQLLLIKASKQGQPNFNTLFSRVFEA